MLSICHRMHGQNKKWKFKANWQYWKYWNWKFKKHEIIEKHNIPNKKFLVKDC